VPGADATPPAPDEVRSAAPGAVPAAAPVDAPTASRDLPDAAAVAVGGRTPPPDPAADDVWADEPWPASDPWVTATVMPREAGEREPAEPAQVGPAASAGSEPRGLDLLRSVFPGRVLQVVSDASEAAVDSGTGSPPADPLDPDEAALDLDPGGPP
jgi:hypothetical protein